MDVDRLGSERGTWVNANGLVLAKLDEEVEHQCDVVGMDELDAIAPDNVVVAKDVGQRVRMPDDVEGIVKEQGELALGPAQPGKSPGCPFVELSHSDIIGTTRALLHPNLPGLMCVVRRTLRPGLAPSGADRARFRRSQAYSRAQWRT
jgi:hypothetical protein